MATVAPGFSANGARLAADGAGGLWSLTDDQACHRRIAPPVRVEGVHHLERLTDPMLSLAVQISPGAMLETSTLDGAALTMVPDGSQRWTTEASPMDEGWHTLEVLADGPDGPTRRRVNFEQRRIGDLLWDRDIEPIFEEHCSGGRCHGPSINDATRPDLSTREAWVEHEDAIVDRVVATGDMPPADARQESWGLEVQLRVAEWFETGAAMKGKL